MSGIRLPDCSKLVINQNNDDDVTICRHVVIVKVFDVILSLLSSLVTGPKSRFLSLPNIWRYQVGISNLTQIFLINCYSMLWNVRVTALTVSELLWENQQGRKIIVPPRLPLRIFKNHLFLCNKTSCFLHSLNALKLCIFWKRFEQGLFLFVFLIILN